MAKVGRPTTYKPEYCNVVIEKGKEGCSYAEMAVACGTVRATLDYWKEIHPEFSTALAYARELSQVWWEETGRTNLGKRDFNAQLWLKNVASRFRDDYAERRINELMGKDGGPVQIETKTIKSAELDDDTLEALELALASAIEAK